MNLVSHFLLFFVSAVAALGAAPILDRKPEVLSTAIPVISQTLLGIPGEVVLLVDINAHGFVTDAKIQSSSNPELGQPCLDAIRKWKFSPAMKEGKAIASKIVQPLRFGDLMVFTEATGSSKPKVLRMIKPEIPEALRHITGTATVRVSLDAEGRILEESMQSSTDEELNIPCMSAVQQWSFAPARKDGHPVSSVVYIPFLIFGSEMKDDTIAAAEIVENRDLVPLRQNGPAIPERLRHVNAEAEISFAVDKNGYVSSAKIKSSTNEDLALLARQAVLEWRFRPVVRNGAAVVAKALQPFRFGDGAVSFVKIDSMPSIARSVRPELPESLGDVSGRVKVLFIINPKGDVLHAEVKDSSIPELVAPVLAAARQWKFKPALKAGVPVESKVIIPFVIGK